MSGTAPVTTFWRIAGMSYLQYANRAASAVRSGLKEPAKSKLLAQDLFSYKTSSWTAGVQGPKTLVTKLSSAGAGA